MNITEHDIKLLITHYENERKLIDVRLKELRAYINPPVIKPIKPVTEYIAPTYIETKIAIIQMLKIYPKSHTKDIVKWICKNSDKPIDKLRLAPLCYRIMNGNPDEFTRVKRGKRIRWSIKQKDLS